MPTSKARKEKKREKDLENNAIGRIIERNPRLDEYFDAFREYLTAVATSSGYLNSLFASSEGGLGKGLLLNAKVYTPSGFKLNKDLKIGDYVLTPTNKKAKIIGIFPQGKQQIYEVTFKDGTRIKCDENHLWQVGFYKWKKEKIFNIKELKKICDKERDKLYINPPEKLDFNRRKINLNPYILGYLIGDGNFGGSIRFSTNDEEVVDYFKTHLLKDHSIIQISNYDYRIKGKRGKNHYLKAIKDYGLFGKKSFEKFIPKDYLYNTKGIRLELLRGLMDSDGTAEKPEHGSFCYYSTSSERLAEDFKFLVNSLGGICYIKERIPKYTWKGVKKIGRKAYRCVVQFENEKEIFKLKRKQIRAKIRKKYHIRRHIKEIKKLNEKEETLCIMLDKEHLYLTDNFVVTHNTTITLDTLTRLKTDYVYMSNYSTVLAFVNYLHENRDKIIVCDDFEEAWKLGAKMFNILKGALWGVGKENKRLVTYLTTSKLLKAPRQFEFKGKIIFLLNKMPNEKDPLVRALLSRGLTYKLDFAYDKIMKILEEFNKLPYKNLTPTERKLIFDYLKSRTDNTIKNLNFRTLLKMYDLYIYDKNNWKSLVKSLLIRDEQLVLINKFIEDCSTVAEAQQKFCEEVGVSRRTFYNLKAKYETG